jgi:hypothetical protein
MGTQPGKTGIFRQKKEEAEEISGMRNGKR